LRPDSAPKAEAWGLGIPVFDAAGGWRFEAVEESDRQILSWHVVTQCIFEPLGSIWVTNNTKQCETAWKIVIREKCGLLLKNSHIPCVDVFPVLPRLFAVRLGQSQSRPPFPETTAALFRGAPVLSAGDLV
jgi:hypothetical protein